MAWGALAGAVLFVGHSLVGPVLPELVEAALAQRMGREAPEVFWQVINGAPLVWNWDHSREAEGVDGRARLAEGGVSDLILTEAQPIAEHLRWSATADLVTRWADAAGPEARIWLYETWPELPPEALAGQGESWRAAVRADRALWSEAAGERARIIPAGEGLARLSEAMEAGEIPGLTRLDQLFVDNIHPNGRGNYFIAMVHVATLSGQSPEGLPERFTRSWASRDAVLDPAQAQAMQRIAQAVAQDEAAEPSPAAATAAPVAAVPDEPAAAPAALPDDAARQPAPPTAGPTAPQSKRQPEPQNAPQLTPISNPGLMFGLAPVNDWSVQIPFLDLMKTARPWVGHLPGQFGGVEEAALWADGVLGPDGWPLHVPAGLDGLATLVLTDLPEDAAGLAGRYHLRWQGKGELRLSGRAGQVQMGQGEAVFDYTPGPGGVVITLAASDPADPVRALSMVREDRRALHAAGEIFNPDWLARLQGVAGLRFMDWLATNDSVLMRAEDRPRPSDNTWARRGVPIEIAVALAARLGADPWITLPHAAEDALVRDWAEVTARGLAPGRRAWVEWSNEVWNFQFTQAQWAEDQARARWDQEWSWLQFYTRRSSEVSEIWRTSFERIHPSGAARGHPRLVRVLATQTGNLGVEEQILAPPRLIAEGWPGIAARFDAWAITGYFSGLLGAPERVGMVRDWIATSRKAAEARAEGMPPADRAAFIERHRFDLAHDLALRELMDGSVSGQPVDTITTVESQILPWHQRVAAAHDLDLVMYEGGSHVVGMGDAINDPELTAFFTSLNYHDGMGPLHGALLAAWGRVSRAPFNGFVEMRAPDRWGSWGALRHLMDENARWRALAKGCDPC